MFLIESTDPASNTELIAEKIIRPSHGTLLSRTRLRRTLDRSLGMCTSTIISGRAGTGKTALALDFASQCGRSVAWYKVDAPEAEIVSFFQYLVATISKERPNFGVETLMPLVRTAGRGQIPMLAEAFIYELVEGGTKPLLIVIDDLHLVYDADWPVLFFRRLLPLLPSEVHMLITSRTLPPAPLWRMRSKQTLFVIEEESLLFTRQEAIELLESYGVSCEHASIALDHTHGRVAGLICFATALIEARVPQSYWEKVFSG